MTPTAEVAGVVAGRVSDAPPSRQVGVTQSEPARRVPRRRLAEGTSHAPGTPTRRLARLTAFGRFFGMSPRGARLEVEVGRERTAPAPAAGRRTRRCPASRVLRRVRGLGFKARGVAVEPGVPAAVDSERSEQTDGWRVSPRAGSL